MDLKEFKSIETTKFTDAKRVKYLNEDANQLLYLDSPALEVFRDFRTTIPLIAKTDTSIADMKKKMKEAGKDVILVVDTEHKVTGIIDLHYIEGVAIQKLAQSTGSNITDLVAHEVKLPISDTRMIHFNMLHDAKIGHIVNTLLNDNRHQVLVYEDDNDGKIIIRGYFALSYIKRKLSIELNLTHSRDGVASISRAIK